ncbi:dethiobiotin synthase [Staphylococcus simulans]|uniref:dethiobiotin synthase n=1 Tax=Staphylococcus simulans TaxID=1286 RepID=UPI000D1FBA60|nr:dethiobiotin synthase [Staphylococcus simulans]PTI87212.1 dethiobiotin synthase [Staphylococcus simulans]RIN52444.1 dethiobiotin synthase [Staphylococcus simulans]UXR52217.1 dethiobiotin synthase [Staphylococcus simulans]
MKLFITSTGTDVGKTYVTLLLYQALTKAGYNVGIFKPFQTEEQANGVYPDLEAFLNISGLSYDETSMYTFHEAVSPHLGFKLEIKQKLNREAVINKANDLNQKYDVLLIEGAGGLGVPIYEDEHYFYMTEDLIKDTADQVLSIVPSKLGAISDIIMHQYYLEQHQLSDNILVMNRFAEDMISQDNHTTLEHYLNRDIYTLKENATATDIPKTLIQSLIEGVDT